MAWFPVSGSGGTPVVLGGPLRAWSSSGLVSGDCGTFHLGHSLTFPIHKALTHRTAVRLARGEGHGSPLQIVHINVSYLR